jgi:hypothetical protein
MHADGRTQLAVRLAAALLVLAGGLIHLKLYYDGYRDVPNDNLGRSFLLNAAGSIVLALALVTWRRWFVAAASLVLVNGSLLAFGLSRTDRGIFGFTEAGFHPSPEAALAIVVEIAAAALLVVVLAWDLAAMRPPAPDERPAAG